MTASKPTRSALLVVALLATALLTACGNDSGDAGPTAPAPSSVDAREAGVESASLPGLYVAGDVVVAYETPHSVVFASTRTCDDLSAMLAAGQWRVVDRLSLGALGEAERGMLAGFGGVAGDLLERGDELVFVGLEGVENCTAVVARVASGPLTLEGAGLPGSSPGWATATRCYVSASTGDLILSVYFDTAAGLGGLGQISLRRSGDGYVVTPEDAEGLNMNLIRHGGRLLSAMTGMFAGAAPTEVIPLEPGDGFGGSVTLDEDTTASAPTGQIVLHGLLDPDTYDSEIALGLPFACPRVIETI